MIRNKRALLSTIDYNIYMTHRINQLDKLELKLFHTDHKVLDMEHDVYNYIFNSINNDCFCYTEGQYNEVNNERAPSIIDINSRSLYANFQDIKNYLEQFTQIFNTIVISKTWITS